MSILKRGSVSEAVKALQNDLNTIGVTVDTDGIFGPGTEKGVKTFQTASGIEADGVVGPNTLAKLAEAVAATKG